MSAGAEESLGVPRLEPLTKLGRGARELFSWFHLPKDYSRTAFIFASIAVFCGFVGGVCWMARGYMIVSSLVLTILTYLAYSFLLFRGFQQGNTNMIITAAGLCFVTALLLCGLAIGGSFGAKNICSLRQLAEALAAGKSGTACGTVIAAEMYLFAALPFWLAAGTLTVQTLRSASEADSEPKHAHGEVPFKEEHDEQPMGSSSRSDSLKV